RLFANQNTLPEGAFGNMSALQHQNQPRRNKNSVFIDENFDAYDDQWHYLSTVKKISKIEIEKINMSQYRQDKSPIVLYEKKADEKLPAKVNSTLKNDIYNTKDG